MALTDYDRNYPAANAAAHAEIAANAPTPADLTARERDTVIAALRLWQAWTGGDVPPILSEEASMILDIADNGRKGDGAALSPAEIDALCEHLNGGRVKMATRPDGGAAFPQFALIAGERDGHGDLVEPFTSTAGGMTLLDYFAAHALAALIAAHPKATWGDIATTAYVAAEAMVAESKRAKP